jgi:hypothetical protein
VAVATTSHRDAKQLARAVIRAQTSFAAARLASFFHRELQVGRGSPHSPVASATARTGFFGQSRFYIVQLSYGPTQESMPDRMVLGPREFAALVRDKALTPTSARHG